MAKWYNLEEAKEVDLAAGAYVRVGDIATVLTASGYYVSGTADTNGERAEGVFLDDADNRLGANGDATARVGIGLVEIPALHANRTMVGTNACVKTGTIVSGSGGPVLGKVFEYVSETKLRVWTGKKV